MNESDELMRLMEKKKELKKTILKAGKLQNIQYQKHNAQKLSAYLKRNGF